MSTIDKFIFLTHEIDHKLVNNIKLFYLTKCDLLFVTYDNTVYHYNISVELLKKFEAFCENQVIIKFECSVLDAHYVALTRNGCVYSWGHNRNGQLGDRSTISRDHPKLINSLSDQFIIDISCGGYHTLVLTQCGDVYAFGSNSSGQCGNDSSDDQLIPIKVNIPNTLKVIAISCGAWHSIALTKSGHVFGWGDNSRRQLGIDSFALPSIRIPIPIICELHVPLIKQITCGSMHTLMLSTDGDIYICGRTEFSGGCAYYLFFDVPTKLNSSTKFIKIAATIHSPLCVALSRNNECFIFGAYFDENFQEKIIYNLEKISLLSIKETFASFEQITYKSVINKRIEKIVKYNNSFNELCLISSGGFSSVFKCEHRLTQQLYAIKKISYEFQNEKTVLKELKIFSKLNCMFAVKYYNSWIEENYYLESHSSDSNQQNKDFNQLVYSPLRTQLLHIQMELCSLTLRDAINRIVNECKTSTNTLSLIGYFISSELLYEILECVQYLHSLNPAIIHRDLKPENVLLTKLVKYGRFVKLSDFGLSTFHLSEDQSHTKYIGTKSYKAPELNFTTRYTPKIDIYSLGIIILELFQIDIKYEVINLLLNFHKLHKMLFIYKSNNSDKIMESLLPLSSIKTMALNALNATPDLRPDCEQMLSQHNEWRLTNKQLTSDEEFNQMISKVPKANSIDDNLIEYFIQNKF